MSPPSLANCAPTSYWDGPFWADEVRLPPCQVTRAAKPTNATASLETTGSGEAANQCLCSCLWLSGAANQSSAWTKDLQFHLSRFCSFFSVHLSPPKSRRQRLSLSTSCYYCVFWSTETFLANSSINLLSRHCLFDLQMSWSRSGCLGKGHAVNVIEFGECNLPLL